MSYDPAKVILDPRRLESLVASHLLDSPPEESFDRLTRLATRVLDAPVALLSLVDRDRQYFKSCVGLPEPWATERETPLSHSFCQHVVATGAPLVVENARDHPLVCDNPAITELNVVSYAGIPLIGSDGQAIGSFCVIDGRPRQWTDAEIGILQDLASSVITEIQLRTELVQRKRLDEALRHSEEQFRGAFDFAAVGMALVGLNGQFLKVNRALCEAVGYPEEDLLALTFQDITHPEDLEADLKLARQLLEGQIDSYQFEKRYIHRDGRTVWILLVGSLVRDPAGRPVNFIAQVRDVTARKVAEEALRESEARYRMLLDTANEGVWTIDSEGRTDYVNRRMADLLGYEPEEMAGRPLFDFMDAAARRDAELYESRRRSGIREVHEFRFQRRDGEELWALLATTPIPTADGGYSGALAMVTDITDRKRAEAALLRAKVVAEQATRAKSEFLANMSHEIRTPMNGIIGMTELLLDTGLTQEQREYLDMVLGSAESLLHIIDDILDFSRVEAGKLELDHQPFRIAESLSQPLKVLGVRAAQKGLAYTFRVLPDVPVAAIGDVGRIQQVLVNLVGNAIKFTEAGGVAVEVALTRGTDDGLELHFSVRDTGIGIAADRQGDILEPFAQGDPSTTRRYGGTGLGLAISARLVELMGGRIWIDSEPGQGTTVHFTARLGVVTDAAQRAPTASAGQHEPPSGAAREAEAPQPSPAPAARSLRILLAEDNPVNERLIVALLTRRGHDVAVTENGRRALEVLERESFDLVLMDVQMPGMGGLEAVARIRELEAGTDTHLPVIALTAHAMPRDRERCLAAGMDGYLAKPFRPAELYAAIEEARHSGGPDAAASEAGEAQRPEPLGGALLDRAVLLEAMDGDEEQLRTLAGLFLEDAPMIRTALKDAVARADAGEMERIAHRLKGSASIFRARNVAVAAAALEVMARCSDLDGAARVAGELEPLLEHLTTLLAEVHGDPAPQQS
jgi:two-component system, sensor histidine kinase and response regulator